jgi:hypothetical protein
MRNYNEETRNAIPCYGFLLLLSLACSTDWTQNTSSALDLLVPNNPAVEGFFTSRLAPHIDVARDWPAANPNIFGRLLIWPVQWTRYARRSCGGGGSDRKSPPRDYRAGPRGEITRDFPVAHFAEFMEGLLNTVVRQRAVKNYGGEGGKLYRPSASL